MSTNTNYQIIYLNGPTSSGKTTLAHLLQQELYPPFLHIGIDCIIAMMPENLNNWEGGPAHLGFSWKQSIDETGREVHEIQLGPFAKKMVDSLKEIVLTLARLDHHIIIDDVALGKQDVDKWRSDLKDYSVLWVGIHTPLSLLEQREKLRGDRIIGSARAQYSQVHKGVVYDLEFDTSKDSSEKIVSAIKEKLCPTNQ
jgi:chloramphenicol 3-O phosphotransferase